MYLVNMSIAPRSIPKYNAVPMLKSVFGGSLSNDVKFIKFEQILKGIKNHNSNEKGHNLSGSKMHHKCLVAETAWDKHCDRQTNLWGKRKAQKDPRMHRDFISGK